MRSTPGVFICSLLAAVAAAAAPACATTVVRLSDEELVAASARVIEARVESVASYWNPARDQIFTQVDLAVSEVLKGPSLGPRLSLRLLGGTADGITMTVLDAPSFSPGEQTLLCLGPNLQALFPVVGLAQGKFTFERDPVTGVEQVRERAVPRSAFVESIRTLTQK
jgi:hypothetical protein